MSKVIIIGCDLHDAWMRLRIAVGSGKSMAKSFATAGVLAMIVWIKEFAAEHGAARIVFVRGQGPARVRHLLCQAAWAAQRVCSDWKARYEQLKRGSQKRSKIAIVALMRLLAIQMWHTARSQELDKQWDVIESPETSARARQKGPPHPPYTITSACSG